MLISTKPSFGDQNQNQFVTRSNDNHSPGPVMREVSLELSNRVAAERKVKRGFEMPKSGDLY